MTFIEVTNARGQKFLINPTHIRVVEAAKPEDPATITFPGDDADSVVQTVESYADLCTMIAVATNRDILTVEKARKIMPVIEDVQERIEKEAAKMVAHRAERAASEASAAAKVYPLPLDQFSL